METLGLNKKILLAVAVAILSLSYAMLAYADSDVNPLSFLETPSDERQFSRQGIFGCTGGQYAPVGLQGPDGAYVPVFDIATHSQVQLLAYKECVLDPLNAHTANSVLAKTIGTQLDIINQQDLIIKDYSQYIREIEQNATVKFLTETCQNNLADQRFAGEICGTIAKEVQRSIQGNAGLECPLTEQERLNPKNALYIMTNYPGCVKSLAYYTTKSKLNQTVSIARQNAEFNATEGGGFKPVTALVEEKYLDTDGTVKTRQKEVVVTPASIVKDTTLQAVTSGIRKLENTKEIDEIVQSFFANLSNRVLDAGRQGLYGINKSVGGDPVSYLSQMVKQEKDVADQFKASVGGLSLKGMINNEIEYIQNKQKLVTNIINAIHNLRANENKCFDEKVLPGAKKAFAKSLNSPLCPGPTVDERGNVIQNPCQVDKLVTVEKLPNYLDIQEDADGNLINHGVLKISGISPQPGDATVVFTNTDGSASSTTASVSGAFSVNTDSKELPNGDLSVSITYPDGSTSVNNMFKETVADVPVIVLPTLRYQIKLSGTAKDSSGVSSNKELVLQKDRRYSNVYTGSDSTLTQSLIKALKDIEQSNLVIEALYGILQDAKTDPDLATWKIDQLVAKKLPHNSAQARKAKQEAINASGNLPAFVENVLKDEWEASGAGWCNPGKWEEFKI